jgi:PhoH-like ATPase
VVDGIDSELIGRFYANGGSLPAAELPCVERPRANENFVLRNGSKSALASYRHSDATFVRVEKQHCYGISPRNAEQSFALRALTDDSIKLVTLTGTAGTGKTLLALAAALECRQKYRQILLARPVVPLSNRDLGFLPGDVAAKLDPYMQPLYDNLAVIRHQCGDDLQAAQRISEMRESEKLTITPLAYIRGRSLQRMFFIVDEAQNRPHGRRRADRSALSRRALQRPELSHQSHDGAADLRARHAGEGGAVGAGRSRQRDTLDRIRLWWNTGSSCQVVALLLRQAWSAV